MKIFLSLYAASALTALASSISPVYEWDWKREGKSGFSANAQITIHHDRENALSFRTGSEKGGLQAVTGPDLDFGPAENFERSFRIRTCYRVFGKVDFAQLRIRGKDGQWLEGDRKISENIYLLAFRNAEKTGEWISEERTFYLPPGKREGKLVFFLSPVKEGELQVRSLIIEETGKERTRFIPDGGDPVIQEESGRVTVRIPDPENVLRATLSATDEEGNLLFTNHLPAGSPTGTIILKERGFYTLRCDLLRRDGKQIVDTATFAVTGPPLPEEIRKHSRYGICLIYATPEWGKKHNFSMNYNGWGLSEIRRNPDGSLRYRRNPGRELNSKALFRHAALFGLPGFLNRGKTDGGIYPPEDWNMLSEAVRLWVRNTPDLPDVVNVFNEPNSRWKGSCEELIKFHNVISEAVKKERPDLKVGGPGFSRIKSGEFKQYIQGGILKNMDYLIMHAYVYATPPEKEFIRNIIELQEFMKTTPYAHLPIAFTEFGWCSEPGDWQKPVDELTKARYLARSILLCTVRNINHLMYFAAKYYPRRDQYAYSIVNPDLSPLPAMASYQTLIRELASVKGGGRWIRIAPDVHFCTFRRGTETVSAVWCQNGTRELEFRGVAPTSLRSMTGTPCNTDKGKISLSPSPSYAVFPGTELAEAQLSVVRKLLPETGFRLDGDAFLLPSELLRRADGSFVFRRGAPFGEYAVPVRRNGTWTFHRFELMDPVRSELTNVHCSKHTTELSFRLSTRFPGKIPADLKLTLDNNQTFSSKTVLSAEGVTVSFSIPNLPNGHRQTGKLTVSVREPIAWTFSAPVDFTPLTAPYFKRPPADPWSSLEPIPVHLWGRDEIKPEERSSAKAYFKLWAEEKGIHLQVCVEDPVLVRSRTWETFWKEDSIQVAFDADTDKEWDPNNFFHSLNGHRIVEFGAAFDHGKTLPAMLYFLRHAENLPKMPFAVRKAGNVRRDEKNGQTVYTLFFEWKYLGIKTPPEPNSNLGFSLLINDRNPGEPRKVLNYFNGIFRKDATRYGKVRLLRPAP